MQSALAIGYQRRLAGRPVPDGYIQFQLSFDG